MPQFGTAVFDVLLDDSGRRPALERASGVVIEPVPYAQSDHVQFGGRGSFRLALEVAVPTDAAWATLSAYVGEIGRASCRERV